MTFERSSGILLHPTSLPGRYGIGSFNQSAYEWVDFLAQTRQGLWQVLPLGPTGYADSPYQSFSTFAGNPYLISLEELVRDGLLDQKVLDSAPEFPRNRVNYGMIYNWKLPVLRRVASGFGERATPAQQTEFKAFCADQSAWLDDYALFMALKDAHDGASWITWEMDLRGRKKRALNAATKEHAAAIQGHKINQWLFFRQWLRLKAYANEKGIRIIGDIPIYVAMDSADTWANPKNFFLDDQFQPTVVAGVPPDYFSATGQLWGNPIYNWSYLKRTGYQWWIERIQAVLKLYDIVRIDHFRGFADYWEVPSDETTAINGRWMDGPGSQFFDAVKAALGELPIIAEDLGILSPSVVVLRNQFDLPGMKILQFAFSSDASDKFLPHNYKQNFVVYTGTHDNDTSWGWYQVTSTPAEQDYFRRYLRTDGRDVPWSLIDAAWRSVAVMAVAPLQDILGLGTDARMNLPGRADGNWQWRYVPEQINGHMTERLREVTVVYGRHPEIYAGKGDEAGGQ
ncbi:MAG: 4-alpha-glucanotransferase [Caldilineaceae bacterium]|nr:4-alpha-glucanotransferase [Caldilineaceae bacterium]MBP8107152.1 4-alpha-glucanotransferase [Caldilineaceae bacterium]MBP8121496.1 4-alpha-glucanotransferase [Caldilineaceae bacterium]MBP9073860.1 4-alpha-glucanotransferase [Caldilineaceae bacterium]